MPATNLNDLIKKGKQLVFRKAFVKRRLISDGSFEDDYQEITEDIKRWGSISIDTDSTRPGRFRFSSAKLTVSNNDGRYNPSSNDNSLWNGYLDRQRSLVQIQVGFIHETQTSQLIWTRNIFPSSTDWDDALYDQDLWDQIESPIVFTGILKGDMSVSDKNEVALNIQPLSQVFVDYPARYLVGFTSTGRTASDFMFMLRDQTDGSGNFVFRPFFDNTVTNWNIQTTTSIYSYLDSVGASEIRDKNCWELIEKIAEAENFAAYISPNGIFNFVPKDPATSTVAFEFHGKGSFSSVYGHTIKTVNSFGPSLSKFYNRIEVKHKAADTTTSYEIIESTLTVSPNNLPWIYGSRTFSINNVLINNSTSANVLAQSLFDDLSALKNEIDFTTSLVPHLDILDRISISYDTNPKASANSLWDLNSWAYDSTSLSQDLVFDSSRGDAIYLLNDEFKFLSIKHDLDNLESHFIAREL